MNLQNIRDKIMKDIRNQIPENVWLILDLNKLTIEDFQYIKIKSPCVYRDDIPPLETWYKFDFTTITNEDVKIIHRNFPELFKRLKLEYNELKRKIEYDKTLNNYGPNKK
tara:strand:+ start:172 stop:501 length:330 start_codon:yes stop_codon:yes gene_type:complete